MDKTKKAQLDPKLYDDLCVAVAQGLVRIQCGKCDMLATPLMVESTGLIIFHSTCTHPCSPVGERCDGLDMDRHDPASRRTGQSAHLNIPPASGEKTVYGECDPIPCSTCGDLRNCPECEPDNFM